MIPSDPDVLVIGAGVAGIAAARALAARGRTCLVLEAAGRVGGRAFTESDSLGVPFDHGAAWLHEANDNPLAPLAAALGIATVDHDLFRQRLFAIGGRLADAAELAALAAAEDAFWQAIARAAAEGPDRPASEAAPRGGRFDATIAHWEGAQIFAAELARMSLRDFAATALDGPNLLPVGGLGALVARLAEGLPVRLGARVERLRWSGPGVAAEGSFGTVRARAVIVTVSTGVLAAGGIAFDPPLPPKTDAAIHGLPLGLATKIAFPLVGAEALGLPAYGSLRRLVEGPGDQPMSWVLRPHGADHVIGFVGGEAAWALKGQGAAAAEAWARAEWARSLGAGALRHLGPATVTRWGEDPLFLGAYSHARPGQAEARRVLGRPLAGGRLAFAGEACDPRYAATVAGAWRSGEAAAGATP
jgi:monoamine oxidase